MKKSTRLISLILVIAMALGVIVGIIWTIAYSALQ